MDIGSAFGKALLDLSKMQTPSLLSLMTMDLDSSKSWFSSLSQWNGVPGLRSCQNGCMCLVAAKAYETWLMRPNQDHTSVTVVGVGKSWMASRYFLRGRTL